MRKFFLAVFILVAFVVVVPLSAVAASDVTIQLSADKPTASTQPGTFAVTARLNTASELVNALEGELAYPSNDVEVIAINDGDSVMSYWVVAPKVSKPGIIIFKGLAPGAVSTNSGYLFTVTFRVLGATKADYDFSARAAKAFRNDGRGTVVPVLTPALVARPTVPTSAVLTSSTSSIPTTTTAIEAADTMPPQDFKPVVSRYKSLYDNMWFVAFNTMDAQSGIAYYEVQESHSPIPSGDDWQKAVSPYILKDQSLHSFIHIRAVDKAGNTKAVLITPGAGAFGVYAKYIFWCILLVIFAVGLLLWRKYTHRPSSPASPQL